VGSLAHAVDLEPSDYPVLDQVADKQRRQRFSRPFLRLFFIAISALFVALAIGSAVAPARDHPAIVHGMGVALLLVSCFFLFRSSRVATIDVGAHSVVVGEFARSRRLALSTVDRFVVVPRVNMWGIPGNALALRMRDGEVLVLGEFWSRENTSGFSVERGAEQLNEWVALRSTRS
jgi:hypothetical protein